MTPEIAAGIHVAFVAGNNDKKRTTANEGLMRVHAVLRRALLAYGAAAARLQRNPASVPPSVLAKTASLFREFGEDYHERRIEEQWIFPAVRKLKGPASRYPDILQQQHERGREPNDYVLQVMQRGAIGRQHAMRLTKALQQFHLMYDHHAVHEDTVVFIAWKDSLSADAYDEMGEKFKCIGTQLFGHDGFADALKRITQSEEELALSGPWH